MILHNEIIYMLLTARGIKKPKGNGINDSLVRWVCVYAVVFWFFGVGFVRLAAMLPLHIKIYLCTVQHHVQVSLTICF